MKAIGHLMLALLPVGLVALVSSNDTLLFAVMFVGVVGPCAYGLYRVIKGLFRVPSSDRLDGYGIFACVVAIVVIVVAAYSLGPIIFDWLYARLIGGLDQSNVETIQAAWPSSNRAR